jgi:hypothetical protein
MVIAFSVGSKCAVMLPREFINEQVTPAKGLIIERTKSYKTLILVEEIWQFKGLEFAPIEEKFSMSTGRIKDHNWGWQEVPSILPEDEMLIVPALIENLMSPTIDTLEKMITTSVADFKAINRIL